MAAVIPRNLQLLAGRLANLERTVVRVRPMSNDAVSSGQTIHFRLPTNTLIDLHNLQFLGICEIESSENQPAWGLPNKMAQALERVDVVVNGQSITGNNVDYGAYDELVTSWTRDGFDVRRDDYLESGDQKASQFDTSAQADQTVGQNTAMRALIQSSNASADTVYTYRANKDGGGSGPPRRFPFAINGLHGFMHGDFVRFIDTAVLGPVEIRMRLHRPNIMYKDTESVGVHGLSNNHDTAAGFGTPAAYNNAEPPEFTWMNMYMLLDTISFPDDFYRALLAERLSGGGIITIPYRNVFSFTKAMGASSDTITFNLATQSLDMLWATFRNMSYLKRWGKRAAVGTGNTNYYKFVSVDNTDYSLGPFTHKTTYQWMVNNKLMPSWPVNVDETHALTRAAMDQVHWRPTNAQGAFLQFPSVYRDNVFLFAQALNHHAEQDKIISGMDTRGASSNMAFSVMDANVGVNSPAGQGAYSQVQVLLFALATSTLEISAGQNVQVIF
jgi:hypothetical protein